jgi:hypothetical protein
MQTEVHTVRTDAIWSEGKKNTPGVRQLSSGRNSGRKLRFYVVLPGTRHNFNFAIDGNQIGAGLLAAQANISGPGLLTALLARLKRLLL